MHSDTPQLAVSRVFDAPRALVFRTFTDPDHLAMWWGPSGNSLPRGEIEFDVRPGGFQRWTEVAAAEPDLRVHVYIDLTDVADCDLLEGVMHVSGQLQEGFELPAHLAGPSNQGWLEAFEKLDATLLHLQAVAADIEV